MKRILIAFLFLLTLGACSTLQEEWKANSATPSGKSADADVKFKLGASEKTASEEKTDLYNDRSDGLIKDLSIGVSNSWKF